MIGQPSTNLQHFPSPLMALEKFLNNMFPTPNFDTGLIVIPGANVLFDSAHGLGQAPILVECYLQMFQNGPDGGFLPGDFFPIRSFFDSALICNMNVGANATNVWVASAGGFLNNQSNMEIAAKDGSGQFCPDLANFKMRILAWK